MVPSKTRKMIRMMIVSLGLRRLPNPLTLLAKQQLQGRLRKKRHHHDPEEAARKMIVVRCFALLQSGSAKRDGQGKHMDRNLGVQGVGL